ncbi:insulin-like peptide INSL5 [Rhinopithecus roxellana]|uniref:Insulin-like peptide INSL5 n=3 Tax=Colobinae TaxID=9569 RepID=A0A2K6N0N1_RHIBE|nr:insulin-like peptide INSL5 [Rhinopithecus roxellana]XP_017732775.1 PREDICTED: insulin-like peptide INSL5 [Rhinopithecus bieti]
MKGSVFTLFLFSVLFAISEVRSKESVRLCGAEYIRTVIYICASSRWRRHLEGIPQAQQAETGNSFQLPNKREFSEENPAQNLPKVDASGEDRLWGGQTPTEELWKSKKRSVMSRQDLQTLCCTDGCSMTDLSALC